MATSIAKIITGVGFVVATTLSSASAATIVNGGVIHFRGAVVEDPCQISPKQQQLAISCPHEGKIKTSYISYRDALNGYNAFPDVVTVSMKYINPEKSLAVVQIDYR